MHSYYIWTIGCQMNKADSERLESALGQMGLSPTKTPKEADVVVLNSCVVRQSAEDKVVGMLTSLKPLKQKDPEKIVALMGCMVGPKTLPLQKRFPYVDAFMQPQQFEPLINLLGERMGIDPDGCVGPLVARADVTTYIPIIHGCDKFCSFCIIPYRRGREVSRSVEDIVREANLLAQRGVREVTLLGQNVDSYGHDLPGDEDLGDLLAAVNDVDGLERVRFLTSHPNDMSNHIIDMVAELDKVCEHVNLPLQAGDDEILQRMRRGYTNDQYRLLIDKIRDRIPNVSLSTDLIVGFCGETEAQFERTVELIRDTRFDKVHAAAYSTRAGDHRIPHDGGRRPAGGKEGPPQGHRRATGANFDRNQRATRGSDGAGPRRGYQTRQMVRPQQERQAGIFRGCRRPKRGSSRGQDRNREPVVSTRDPGLVVDRRSEESR